jgi:hypothetical protein
MTERFKDLLKSDVIANWPFTGRGWRVIRGLIWQRNCADIFRITQLSAPLTPAFLPASGDLRQARIQEGIGGEMVWAGAIIGMKEAKCEQ